MTEHPRTRALYNGDCPICKPKRCHYSDEAGLPVACDGLTQTDFAATCGARCAV